MTPYGIYIKRRNWLYASFQVCGEHFRLYDRCRGLLAFETLCLYTLTQIGSYTGGKYIRGA